jgi:hypothetical protein
LRNVLQDAPQVSWFHVGLLIGCSTSK